MAWFNYECSTCQYRFKVSLKKRLKSFDCSKCEGTMYPVMKIGTSRTVEVLDNGLMSRRVERLHNVEDIMAERDAKFKKDTEAEEIENDDE